MPPFRILFVKPFEEVHPSVTEVPLGILYLSAYLKQTLPDRLDIRLLDLRLCRRPQQDLLEMLAGFKPDLIGLSLLALNEKFLNSQSTWLRRQAPAATLVIGGPYVTGNYEQALQRNPEIDYAVIGEGEKPFCQLVQTLLEKRPPGDLASVAWRSGGQLVVNPERDYIANLDDLPFPDYGLLTLVKYWKNDHHTMNGVEYHKRYTHVISSRACPYRCIYCHDVFGKQVRLRSPENFVAEIQFLQHHYGIGEFHIVDDIFNLDQERLHRILQLIIQWGLKIKIAFPNGLRGDLLTEADIDLMQQAGVYMITFALESGSPRIQKKIRKNLDIDKVLNNIRYTAEKGMLAKGFFMLGFPGETVAEMKQTIEVAVRSRLDLAQFFTVTPFPGTALADLAGEMYPEVELGHGQFYFQQTPFYQLATGYNLKRLQKLAYLRFYLSWRTVRTFRKIPRKFKRLQRWAIFAREILQP